ncbi:MAG TPA: transketolase [Patescibacteria group bacterium]|nr:transketolase [Patescibacteria group bacterium]
MNHTTNELKKVALQVRKDIIDMIYKAGSGHPGGSLSATEILVAIYFEILKDDDVFFLSNGHVCPALYAVMAEKGMIEKSLLDSYTTLNSPLQGHPERTKLKGIMNTSGPLGLGLAQASGYAAIKKDSHIYCMTSDAEHDEGNHWEAVMFAAKYNLNNLIQFIDRNRIQIEGTVEEIMPLGNLIGRYRSFGWKVMEIDGHDFNEIIRSVETAKEEVEAPTVIVANTLFGKGVSYMENDPDWHAKAPNEVEYKKAMEELK